MSLPLTPTEQLLALADRHRLPAESQLALIQGAAEAKSLPELVAILHVMDEELAALLPQTTKEPDLPTLDACFGKPKAMTAQPAVPELEAFFDRNLARHSLKKLVQLPTDGPAFERVGYDTARLVVPKAEMEAYTSILEHGLKFQTSADGIVAGWYTIFADGSTAAVAIVNAKVEDGGAYVDAFLILPDGVHPTVPNVSLPPARRLDEDFVFAYPDGTYRVLRLVPSTV